MMKFLRVPLLFVATLAVGFFVGRRRISARYPDASAGSR